MGHSVLDIVYTGLGWLLLGLTAVVYLALGGLAIGILGGFAYSLLSLL